MSIALKEARETRYWIYLLTESGYLDEDHPSVNSLEKELDQLLRLLTSIVKTSRRKLQ
jgi:four helix bundle protein